MGVGEGAGTRCPGLGPGLPPPPRPSRPSRLARSSRAPPRGSSEEGFLAACGGRGGREGVNLLVDCGGAGGPEGPLGAPERQPGGGGGFERSRSVRALQTLGSSFRAERDPKAWGCPAAQKVSSPA